MRALVSSLMCGLVVCAGACRKQPRHGGALPPQSTGVAAHSSPATGGPDDSAATGDTAARYTTPFTPPSSGFLAASTTVEAPEWYKFGDRVAQVHEGDRDVLLVAISDEEAYGVRTFFLKGPWPRGRHHLDELWDGVSGWQARISDVATLVHAVPGALGDGASNYWLEGRLAPGPLMGAAHFYSSDEGRGSVAYLEQREISGESPFGYEHVYSGLVHATGFDANHDGYDDILVHSGPSVGHRAWVVFGPFEGELPFSDRYDNTEHTALVGTSSCGDTTGLTMLYDFLGPGRDVVAYGGSDVNGLCSSDADVKLYELDAQPGDNKPIPLAWFNVGTSDIQVVGDVDGDGVHDLMIGPRLVAGPFIGDMEHHFDAPDMLPVVGGEKRRVIGDVNADGVIDHIIETDDHEYFVHLSPFEPPLVARHGIHVEPGGGGWAWPSWRTELVRGDFDGDGLGDIAYVSREQNDIYAHEVHVYLGSDLVATWFAQGLDTPPVRVGESASDTSDTGR